MHNAAQAYAKTAQTTLNGKDLEASVLLRAAAKLQSIRENWDAQQHLLEEALSFNRKIWVILSASVAAAENPLPKPLKQNILNLSIFIFNHSMRMISEPAAERLGVLININRDIAGGLMAKPAAPAQP